jgi:hypothetical protein
MGPELGNWLSSILHGEYAHISERYIYDELIKL